MARMRVAAIKDDRLAAIHQAEMEESAAIAIQAIVRGHLARTYVAGMQAEIAAFLRQMRTQEDKELEAEYFVDHTAARLRKQMADYYENRVAKRREMARKMQRNLAAEVVDLTDGVVLAEDAMEDERAKAEDREAFEFDGIDAGGLRELGRDRGFFRLIRPEDLKAATAARVRKDVAAHDAVAAARAAAGAAKAAQAEAAAQAAHDEAAAVAAGHAAAAAEGAAVQDIEALEKFGDRMAVLGLGRGGESR